MIVAKEDVSGGALEKVVMAGLHNHPRVQLGEVNGKHEAFSSRRHDSNFFEVFDAMLDSIRQSVVD